MFIFNPWLLAAGVFAVIGLLDAFKETPAGPPGKTGKAGKDGKSIEGKPGKPGKDAAPVIEKPSEDG